MNHPSQVPPVSVEPIDVKSTAELAKRLLETCKATLGQTLIDLEPVIESVLIAIVAGGHVLLEGVPGTAKTTLCRTLAGVIGLDFGRIQFTPDLLPSDVTGTKILDQEKSKFVLQTGPIFCQLLLADELNRAPARTQAALLEAMQESQVTIEGETLKLPREVKEYIVDLTRATRDHRETLLGASTRAGIFLLRAARSRSLLHGRDFVSHEDVQAIAHSVLEHRVIVRPEAELSGVSANELVDDVIRSVPVREA